MEGAIRESRTRFDNPFSIFTRSSIFFRHDPSKKERLCNDPHLSNLGYYEVSELVSRIEKYVSTKSGDSINLPVAEAMVTYKEKTYDDGESSQVFVPFVRYDPSNTSNFIIFTCSFFDLHAQQRANKKSCV